MLGLVTSNEGWLKAVWPFVRAHLPGSPATVLEVGCGPSGGFVPVLVGAGYDAVGVDPEGPDAPGYHRVRFEQYELARPVDVVVACTSLHHVADLAEVLDRVATALSPDGVLIVVEYAWERFDETTARWCFARLPSPGSEPGWLHGHRDKWAGSGQSWPDYRRDWATAEKLHTGTAILAELDARFDRRLAAYGPYFFSDLVDIGEADEQAAIDLGQIAATGIRYVGTPGQRRTG